MADVDWFCKEVCGFVCECQNLAEIQFKKKQPNGTQLKAPCTQAVQCSHAGKCTQDSANLGAIQAKVLHTNVGELYVLPTSRKVSHMLDDQKLSELNSGQEMSGADGRTWWLKSSSVHPRNKVWQRGGLSRSMCLDELHGCGSSVLYIHKGHHRAYLLCQHIVSQQRPQVVQEFDLLWLQPACTAAVCQAEVPISGCLHMHMLTSAEVTSVLPARPPLGLARHARREARLAHT